MEAVDHIDRRDGAASAAPLPKLGGRFSVRRKLGAGGMGEVFEAYDAQLHSVVALKMLRADTASSLLRFKREFRALADVLHPNLVTLYDLVAARRRWMFTMELISGTDLMDHVRDDLPRPSLAGLSSGAAADQVTMTVPGLTRGLDTPATNEAALGDSPQTRHAPISSAAQLERLRASFAQLVDGVEAIHERGYLHRDLKPSNVLVEPDGRVVVLDFGIIEQMDGGAGDGTIVGTAAYLAPEAAAVQDVGPASDWYGVGVMLFEALTGTRPFAGDSKTVLAAKCGLPAPRCRHLAPDVPADLADLCDGLLALDPADRPSGREAREVFASGAATPVQVAARSSFTPRFVGRDAERARLDTALSEVARTGRPRCVRVHGVSGMGKSTLVESFLRGAREDANALVLEGRCRPHEVVPYKALDGLVDSLAQALNAMPEGVVAEIVPGDIRSAARLFPVLETVSVIASEPAAPRAPGESAAARRRRGFAALLQLLARLGERQPLVLYIDDVQWGDRDSAAALVAELGVDTAPGLLLLIAYRTDEAAASAFLAELDSLAIPDDEIEVAALDDASALELAGRCVRAHGGRPELAREIVAEVGGNPLLVAELAAAASQRDSLTRGALHLSDLVAERIAQLPDGARRLMDILTVAGARTDRRTALAAAGLDDGGQHAIKALVAARLARRWQTPRTDALETYHDRIREAHAAALGVDAARRCHRDLATALDELEPDQVEALAVHWEAAGDVERAAGYFERAGERAGLALAFERAAAHFEHALALAPRQGDAKAALLGRLGAALSDGGEGVRAAAVYGEAADCAEGATALRYRGKQAEELLRSSRIDEGMERLHEVLAAIGEPLPRGRAGLLASIAYQRARIAMRGLEVRPPDGELDGAMSARLELYRKTITSLAYVDPVQAIAVQCRYLRAALDVGDPAHAAVALGVECNFQSLGGPSKEAKIAALCAAAHEQAELADDDLARFYTTYAEGFLRFHCGDFAEGRALFAAANDCAARVPGGHWEQLKADEGTLWCDYFLGAYRRLVHRVTSIHASASARGDLPSLMTVCTGLEQTAWLIRDEPTAGREVVADVVARWTDRGYHLVHYWALFSDAQTDLYIGDAVEASARMERGWRDLERSGLLRILGIAREALHTRARAAIAAAADGPSEDVRGLLRVAERATRRLARDPTPLARALVRAQRAAIARVRGDDDAAVAGLRATIEACDSASVAGYGAAARRHLGVLLGGVEGRELVAAADARLEGERVERPDRLAAMLIPGFAT